MSSRYQPYSARRSYSDSDFDIRLQGRLLTRVVEERLPELHPPIPAASTKKFVLDAHDPQPFRLDVLHSQLHEANLTGDLLTYDPSVSRWKAWTPYDLFSSTPVFLSSPALQALSHSH